MATNFDTLSIGSLRLKREYPIAEVQSAENKPTGVANNPEAAAAARARIAAIPDYAPFLDANVVPATPTADLVTDRTVLAHQAAKAPMVSRNPIPTILRPILTAAGIFILVLLLFKAPVIISQVKYSLSNKPSAAVVATTSSEVIPAENTISIPKINVHAPVVYEPSIQEASVQKALESGVVHYGNTAVPGQAGNVAIFGHSSNDWWEPGNYKFVFVLLDKLAPGDQISIDYQSKRYTYEVTSSVVVDPTDVGVLNPTADPTLTLITCTPPGTSLRRLVVTAKQIDPSPTQIKVAVTPQTTTSQSANLPSSNNFGDQVSKAWNSFTHSISSLFGGDNSSSSGNSSGTSAGGQIPAVK